MKECKQCNRDFPATNTYYFNDSKRDDGLYAACKECVGYSFQNIRSKYECEEGFKICRKCTQTLILHHDFFYHNKASSDGYDFSCRVCVGYQYGKTICKEGYKICHSCETEIKLSREFFHVDNANKDGFDNFCKKCKTGKNIENFNIEDWFNSRSKQFKKNWEFKDIEWLYLNYLNTDKQGLVDHFKGNKKYKTITNVIYQWNMKKNEKNEDWSEEDIEFLKNNYPNMSQKELEKRYKNRTWHSIKTKASRLQIHRDEETLLKINRESHVGVKVSDEARKKMSLARRGNKNWNWKGGISPIHVRLREYTIPWKLDSLEKYQYVCAISGINDRTLEIHHLNKNFSEIVYEVFELLNLPFHKDLSEYTQIQRDSIREKILELHYLYGLGVPLRKELHKEFHSIYGNRYNTPNQFEEFKKNKLMCIHKEESDKKAV